MESNPFVSVVMPTHNRADLVGRAIKSVLAQTHPDFELIVVDDGSRDDTRGAVARHQDPRVRYVRNEKPTGPAGARNAGIRAAGSGAFLAFLDDDDEWLPRKLELQLEVFRRSPIPLAAVGCGRFDQVDGGYAPPEVYLPEYRGDLFEHLLARRARGFGAQQIMVRRTDETKDLLFDLDLPPLEDLDFSMQLALRGPFDFVPEPLVRIYRDPARPHVWNSEAAVRGYEGLARKYALELRTRPWIRSYYQVCIARDLAALGRMPECRLRLQAAREGSPHGARLSAWFAASFLGRRGVRLASQVLPIHAPRNGKPSTIGDVLEAQVRFLVCARLLDLGPGDLLGAFEALIP